ncbi:class III chitinase ChiA1 [Aspergillus affinis]|uniref:class III chitinase ChiA1 n=1 Tax=Aspergillus affinis TaxID=1070780 RepID=UPI0022FE9425|nr:glycoside hydrolase [Aspergillus affinis]KAI9041665.1 glycoside hydrolase [Aspergillus affinis]
MISQRALAVVAAISCLASPAFAFDAQSKSNVAVYYGQGYEQPRLREICQDASVDIINLGFINVFPGQGAGGWPGSNFANQCDGKTYEIGGVKTHLLSGCHQLVEDIPLCQAAGKKVLLSLGGASPDTQRILSETDALLFTDFLWGAFGPIDDAWVAMDGPRPFGDVVVDGFDFDIEHNGGFGYATMIDRFREHFDLIPDRTFYISGAPQCSIPDQQLGLAIAASVFDFVWVQFYNTAGCSARDFFNVAGNGKGGFSYDAWVNVIKNGRNRAAKLYIGLPASESAAKPGYYLTPEEVDVLVARYMGRYPDTFGGIMLWEATASERNQIDGAAYAEHMKNILVQRDPAHPTPTAVPSSTIPVTSSRPISSGTTSTSIIVSPTTSSVATTSPSHTSRSSSYPSPSATTKVTSTLTPSRSPVTSGRPSPSTSPVTSRTRSTPVIRTSTVSTITSHSSSSVPSRTPTSHHPSPSTSVIASSTRVSSSSHISSGRPSSSTWASTVSSTISRTSQATTLSPSGKLPSSNGQSNTIPSQGATASSSNETGKPTGSSTGTASHHGSGTITMPPGVTDGPQTTAPANPNGSSSGGVTITTVIVTSYTSICPTGFTTITTTYTTTYCPGTIPATATVTNPPPGSAQTTAPSPPEGWTTTVTVCTQCAATPTTVTLTVPVTATVTNRPSAPESQTNAAAAPPPAGWTTTVTVCTRCGPSPTTLTLTVPVSAATETVPGSGPSVGTGPEGGAGTPSNLDTTNTHYLPPAPTRSPIFGTGNAHPRPSTSTLFVQPSPSESRVPVAPSTTSEYPAPMFTGAAPRQARLSHAAGALLVVALPVLMMM